MRFLVGQLVCGVLLLLNAAPACGDRLEATNSTMAMVDGDTRSTPPDFTATTRTVTFSNLDANFGSGTILDVDIIIDFSKLSDAMPLPPQPWYDEIGFALVSPNGTMVNLVLNSRDFPGNATFLTSPNFNNTAGFSGSITFDDDATNLVNNGPIVGAPNSGTFRPIEPLSAFIGEDAAGTWELWIEDAIGANPLIFNSFTLSIQTSAAAVPEPGSIALGGMALLALIGFGWRQRRSG